MLIGLLLALSGVGVGIFGSLLGLGGGILIVPLLTFAFGVSFREAVGVSLVCVIVTSSAAAGVYLERHVANLRLGMTLELFTASGALVGGLIAFALPDRTLAALFAALLIYTGLSMLRSGRRARPATEASEAQPAAAADGIAADDALAGAEAMASNGALDPAVDRARTAAAAPPDVRTAGAASARDSFVDRLGGPGYRPRRLGLGIAGSVFAGVVSALLGVGGGIVKVPLMHLAMGVPLKVATATSNMMIGVTAAASAIVYLMRGGVDPLVTGPTAVGVFAGAMIGTRLAGRIDVHVLRLLFVAVMALTAVQMVSRALS